MKPGKLIIRFLLILLIITIGYGVYYCRLSFPVLSGYGAKVICSAVFIEGRNEQDVYEQELSFFPMHLGKFTVDYADSSVTGSVFGLAKRKVIYRHGLGATLISELDEKIIRDQHFNLPSKPPVNTDSIPWPMGDKPADTFSANINKEKLRQAVQNSFIEKDSGKPVYTRAVLVLYKGQIVAERYAKGFTRNSRLPGWSMTKSITSALTGILVKQGKLNVDAPATVPEWSSTADPRHTITVKNLLQQNSGLDFLEDYTRPADARTMLYLKADMGGYAAARNLKSKPGTVFYYSSGNSNILSRIIRQTLGDSLYYAFPYQELFYKLGMYNTVMEPDASGTFVGSSYMFATARDWARFGLLYLNNGQYNGEQILTEDWIKQTVEPAGSCMNKEYGYQFWLNKGGKYPAAPADLFSANGYEAQRVFIIPSKKLVIVRLASTHNNNFDENKFLDEIISAIQDE